MPHHPLPEEYDNEYLPTSKRISPVKKKTPLTVTTATKKCFQHMFVNYLTTFFLRPNAATAASPSTATADTAVALVAGEVAVPVADVRVVLSTTNATGDSELNVPVTVPSATVVSIFSQAAFSAS